MKITLAAILALGAVACTGCEEDNGMKKKVWDTPADVLVISENECKDVCGGRICYEDVINNIYKERGNPTAEPKKAITGYGISYSGFDSVDFIGKRFILADECIFYKKSAKKELLLERLR